MLNCTPKPHSLSTDCERNQYDNWKIHVYIWACNLLLPLSSYDTTNNKILYWRLEVQEPCGWESLWTCKSHRNIERAWTLTVYNLHGCKQVSCKNKNREPTRFLLDLSQIQLLLIFFLPQEFLANSPNQSLSGTFQKSQNLSHF